MECGFLEKDGELEINFCGGSSRVAAPSHLEIVENSPPLEVRSSVLDEGPKVSDIVITSNKTIKFRTSTSKITLVIVGLL